MARTKQTGRKREKEKDKQKKRKDKEHRKQERKKQSVKGLGLDALVAVPLITETGAGNTGGIPETTAPVSVTETRAGKVVYLNTHKGYGFIRDAKVKENLFFEIGDIKWELRLNDTVTFVRTKSSRGGTATSIEKLPENSVQSNSYATT